MKKIMKVVLTAAFISLLCGCGNNKELKIEYGDEIGQVYEQDPSIEYSYIEATTAERDCNESTLR